MTRALSMPTTEPDFNQLTTLGWSIISCVGPYVTVWRDGEEHVLLWKNGIWLRLDNGSPVEFSPPASTGTWND